jgi:hypothetical protein
MKFISTWMLVALSSMAGCQLLVSFNGVAETNAQCDDSIDNDQDGRTDCDDPSCTGSVKCGGIGGDGGSALDASMTMMDGVVVKDSVMNDGGSTNFDQDLRLPPLPPGTNCTTAGRFGNARKVAAAGDLSHYVAMLCGDDVYVAAAAPPPANEPISTFKAPVVIPKPEGVAFEDAEIAVNANGIHVAAMGTEMGSQNVYYFQSVNAGDTWTLKKIIRNASSMSLAAKDNLVAIAVARPNELPTIYLENSSTRASFPFGNKYRNIAIAIGVDPQNPTAQYAMIAGALQSNPDKFEFNSPSGPNMYSQRVLDGQLTNPAMRIAGNTLILADDKNNPRGFPLPLPMTPDQTPEIALDFQVPATNQHRSMSVSDDGTVIIAQVDSQGLLIHRSSNPVPTVIRGANPTSPSVVAIPGTMGGSTVVWTDGTHIRTHSSLTP